MMFTSLAKGLYECISDSGKTYVCDLDLKSCTCWGFRRWGHCRHLKKLGVKE